MAGRVHGPVRGLVEDLTEKEQEAIVAAEGFLEEFGPALGRPFVDTVKASRHANMKELRPMVGNIRILFAFDPRRTAILLIGGDKRPLGRLVRRACPSGR